MRLYVELFVPEGLLSLMGLHVIDFTHYALSYYMSGVPKDIYYDSLQNYFFSDRAETFFLDVLAL